ncbi:hypothetical protein [Alkaliphilus transvaalensis]|uniref:hypothetical protein n=1 Tax=Alkaliphilus transvaalensis TaxID=114628 RepID=UPI00047C8207|nr:hypothetical protein [Alkaliphilus transvaalensis]
MKNKVLYLILILMLVLLTACSQGDDIINSEYYTDVNEAIANSITEDDVFLSVEKYQNTTLLFFERDGGLGTSVLTEKGGKYKFERQTPITIFESDGEYLTGGFSIETEKGEKINILSGEVFDPVVSKIILEDIETKESVEIWSREFSSSRFFYYVLGDEEYTRKNVISIEG